MTKYDLETIFAAFDTTPANVTFDTAEEFGSGHINDTFRVSVKESSAAKGSSDGGGGGGGGAAGDDDDDDVSSRVDPPPKHPRYYILQRINHRVFTRPVEVMDNMRRVTAHLAAKIEARGGDPLRETLTLLPTTRRTTTTTTEAGGGEGELERLPRQWYEVDDDGNYWRVFHYIDAATTYDTIDDERHVTAAARAFGEFQRDLFDLPAPRLYETIPGFGDTAVRFEQFETALSSDCGKSRAAEGCQKEIDFCLARRQDASILANLLRTGAMPERITHYDTKINNVMIDDATGRGLCVIDLDTVMPGMAVYDFGDAVRTATALGAEDEVDLNEVGFSMERFELLAEGYLSVAKEFLNEVEVDHLAFAAKIVAFTIGLRFLTDHLNGDVYFKVSREGHNLDRARTQFKTVEDMEERYEEMKLIVDKYRK